MSRQPLLNVKQVAEIFQCHPNTIFRWLKSGYLPQPVKRFGSPMWDYDEIMAHLRAMPSPSATSDIEREKLLA